MGFKRNIKLVCDGPCGTVVDTEKAPAGWFKLMGTEYISLAQGEKPPQPYRGWYCPKCWERLRDLISRGQFAFAQPPKEDEAAARREGVGRESLFEA